MSLDAPLAEYAVRAGPRRGMRLTLYGNRVACHGEGEMEVVQLSQLASVRVAFERDPGRLAWALGLAAAAVVLAFAAGPARRGIASAVARMGESPRGDSLEALLVSVLGALEGAARLLPSLALALGALAAGLAVLYWLGRMRLSLGFAAVERDYAVRGRDRGLAEFAESVAARLAARKEH